uniref:Reverse transcriptase domain-containing protein n=1 Tax=Cannabis sativa TaxID=3483 RepID=A0A803NLB8_CANSA
MVTHEGRELGPFVPGRGIRQGDPLSPHLFLICVEGLSSLVKKYESWDDLHRCRVCNGAPVISHILFADDNYIYCKATEREARNVIRLLQVFEATSGKQAWRLLTNDSSLVARLYKARYYPRGSFLNATLGKRDLEHSTKPVSNTIKVNVDGAIFTSARKCGIGLVARDSSGMLIEAHSLCHDGWAKPAFVET